MTRDISNIQVLHGDDIDPDAWFAIVSNDEGHVTTIKGHSSLDVLLDAALVVDKLDAQRVAA